MRRFWTGLILSLLTCGRLLAGTSPIYINNSPLQVPPDIPPQIDATAFLNQSLFSVNTGEGTVPYQTRNTLFFTNRASGVMSGVPGFRFEFFTNNFRLPMDSWVNRGFLSVDTFSGFFGVFITPVFSSAGPWMLVSATNIVNSGRINAGAQGVISLVGDTIDVSRSTLRTGQPTNGFLFFGSGLFGTNYFNDPGVSELYWGAGTNNNLGTGGTPMRLNNPFGGTNFFFGGPNFNLPNPSSPPHQVIQPFSSLAGGGFLTNQISIPQSTIFFGTNFFFGRSNVYDAFAFTNQTSPSNQIIQVAFVPTNSFDSNFVVDVQFVPEFGFGDNGASVVVEFRSFDFDIATRTFITNSIFLTDTTAFETNIFLARNFNAPSLRRPNTLEIGRGPTLFTGFGFTTNRNTDFTPGLIWNPSYVTNFVPVRYAAYGANITPPTTTNLNVLFGPTFGPSDPTNFSGRVEIIGNKVNMEQTLIRSEQSVILRAKDLVNNRLAQVQAPFVIYDVGSTSQPVLTISNLAPVSVRRLTGTVQAWAATWTNAALTVSTNLGVTTTNRTEIMFHVLVVDHALQSLVPVFVAEFAAQAAHLVIADAITAQQRFRLDAETLTVTGGITLPLFSDWSATNVLNVQHLTNRGTINMAQAGFFGSDRDEPYWSFVNEGRVTAAANLIRAVYFENTGSPLQTGLGTISSIGGLLSIDAQDARLTNSVLFSTSDVEIRANTLIADRSRIQAGSNTVGSLILNVTNYLTDSGVDSSNIWTTSAGFHLSRLPDTAFPGSPLTNDLFGTTIESIVPFLSEARHVWAAEDRGPDGFTNNVVLGKLILDGEPLTLFTFAGAQPGTALYVDFLELRNNATNYNTGAIEVEPGFKIYFADANIPPDKLNLALDGAFEWVPTFTGPSSSTNITYPSGTNYTFNAGVVRSKDLDSDCDGLVNAEDPTPIFVEESINLQVAMDPGPPPMTILMWDALCNATSIVEVSCTMMPANWQVVTNHVQGPITERVTLSVPQTCPTSGFYRVRVNPSGF